MYVEVLVLRNAHLIHYTTVELTVADLTIIWMLATGLPPGEIADRLFLSPITISHHITEIYKLTGTCTPGGLVGFGYDQKFLIPNIGGALKGWENNDVVVWMWRKRKRGENK